MDVTIALIHSPLVGPSTWQPVADELRRRGVAVAVPALADDAGSGLPYWQQHAEAAARALNAAAGGGPLVLVGHSGAGPLPPAVRVRLSRPIAAYLFVDASIPHDGVSRLDLLAQELPEAAAQLRPLLAAGGRFPEWTDDDLRPVIPDTEVRREVLASLRPRPLAFMEEPIPVFAGWPDAPCAYLRFWPGYAVPAAEARRRGWVSRELEGGHFHMLVDPAGVAEALLALIREVWDAPAARQA